MRVVPVNYTGIIRRGYLMKLSNLVFEARVTEGVWPWEVEDVVLVGGCNGATYHIIPSGLNNRLEETGHLIGKRKVEIL